MTHTVTTCSTCPMYVRMQEHNYQWCGYPSKERSTTMAVDMVDDCPLKTETLTIKIETNDTDSNGV